MKYLVISTIILSIGVISCSPKVGTTATSSDSNVNASNSSNSTSSDNNQSSKKVFTPSTTQPRQVEPGLIQRR